jgi:hypothetical protein
MPRFTRLPLDDGCQEIRLIRLLPGAFDDDIQVEIFHEPLSEERIPEYEALSYVWGLQKSHTQSISAHQRRIPRTTNARFGRANYVSRNEDHSPKKLRSKSRRIRRPHLPSAINTRYCRALRTSCLSSFKDSKTQVQMFLDSLPLTSLRIFLLPKTYLLLCDTFDVLIYRAFFGSMQSAYIRMMNRNEVQKLAV